MSVKSLLPWNSDDLIILAGGKRSPLAWVKHIYDV